MLPIVASSGKEAFCASVGAAPAGALTSVQTTKASSLRWKVDAEAPASSVSDGVEATMGALAPLMAAASRAPVKTVAEPTAPKASTAVAVKTKALERLEAPRTSATGPGALSM